MQVVTHGRGNNQTQMAPFAYGLLGQIAELSKGQSKRRDMIVVTLVSG